MNLRDQSREARGEFFAEINSDTLDYIGNKLSMDGITPVREHTFDFQS